MYFPRPKALLRALLISVLVLHTLSLGSHFIYHYLGIHNLVPYFGRLTGFVNVDKEANIPTWFSSMLLAGSAYVLWGVYRHVRDKGGRYRWHWAVLCGVFATLSMDELSHIHEMAGRFGLAGSGRTAYLSWVVFAAPFVLVFALSYLRFLLHLPPAVRRLVLWSGVLYVGGAAGMEVVGALLGRGTENVGPGKPYFHYLLFASAEEAMEMLGAVLFLYAMTLYLRSLLRADATPPALTAQGRPTETRRSAPGRVTTTRPSPAPAGRAARR